MRTFVIIWFGQMVSTIGSYMTFFSFTIWAWELTGSATALALFSFFSQLPRIFVTPFAGIIVDRFSRKYLLILADIIALLCTLAIALLYLSEQLQIWHLYWAVGIYGCFGQIHTLAYSTSIAVMVPKSQYTRAESMVSAVGYGSAIIAPALGGSLYPVIGLKGIFVIDFITFLIAIATLVGVHIPQPTESVSLVDKSETIWRKLTFGFRYISTKPSLIAMVIAFSLFAFPSDLGKAIYNPLILARTDGNAQILGTVTTAAGIGGVIGAVFLSFWGGFKRRINGMLLGFMGIGLFKIVLGLGQTPFVWIGSHFAASLNIPLLYSSSNAIWYTKVPLTLQGRVLAADQMIGLIIAAVASLIAGPLVDRVFEPAMKPDGFLAHIFSPILGTDAGSGIALLYIITALWMMLVGICGYGFRTLRDVEVLLPDAEITNEVQLNEKC